MAASINDAISIIQVNYTFIVAAVEDILRLTSPRILSPTGAVLTLAAYAFSRYRASPWRRLPPGPTNYPVIGSLVNFFDKQWLFHECKNFGDIVYLNLFGQPTVIFNSQRAAADLLDRNAAIFSGRIRSIVAHELLCGGLFIPTEGDTDRWRRMRRAVHEAFSTKAASWYHDMEAEEAVRLALALVSDSNVKAEPGHFSLHYKRFSASLTLTITYDRPVRNAADIAIAHTAEEFTRKIDHAVTPGRHLVELWPALLAVPARFAKWKFDALENHRKATTFLDGLFTDVKARMTNAEARQCLVRTLVEEDSRFGLSKAEAIWAAGTMFIAGTDTQQATLEWFTLAIVSHPMVQLRAQAELDTVIGHARAPRVSDKTQLPYIVALLREVMRWKAVVPLGAPHASNEDTWYNGMFIPKGTLCVINVTACNLDCNVYGSDAEAFNPSRHLDEQGRLKPAPADTKDEGHIAFGFGKRICVGRHVATDALFVAMATILWALNIEKAENVALDEYVDRGMTMCPQPFRCRFTPRFPEAVAILKGELESR